MKLVAVGLVALVALGCSDSTEPPVTGAQAGAAPAGSGGGGSDGGGGSGSAGKTNAGGNAVGGSHAGGKASGGQGGSSTASGEQVPLDVPNIEDFGEAMASPLDAIDAETFCGDITDAGSLKAEGSLMRSPGTGRYFVCLGPLSATSSAALLGADPGAPRSGFTLYAALFHFGDPAHPNPNPGGGGPENFGLVTLELNDANGRSECVSSNATFTGFKDVSVQEMLDGDSACSTGAAKYSQEGGRGLDLQIGQSQLSVELEEVVTGG